MRYACDQRLLARCSPVLACRLDPLVGGLGGRRALDRAEFDGLAYHLRLVWWINRDPLAVLVAHRDHGHGAVRQVERAAKK